MRKKKLAVACFFMFPLAVNAAEFGDARQGLAFARERCAECHAVTDADDVSPNPDAPTFHSVAHARGMTERALTVWLQTSHPTMPNLFVADEDRDNVIAYIMSLKTVPEL